MRSVHSLLDAGVASTSTPSVVASVRPSSSQHRSSLHRSTNAGLLHQHRSWRGHNRQQLFTMAPDKSALVSRLDQLLRLSASTVDPENMVNARFSPAPSGMTGPPRAVTAPMAGPRSPPSILLPMASIDTEDYHPSDGWQPRMHHLSVRHLWERIRQEAAHDAAEEPRLATFLNSVVLSHADMAAGMAFLFANKLADNLMLGPVQLMALLRECYVAEPELLEAAAADLQAVLDRDPACSKYSQCMLYFKGWQAVQAHRAGHFLWHKGRTNLALALQARVSEVFGVDIHPAARLGWGVMLDHATGIVIGETAVVGDNVSMLHHVSLGGSGTGTGIRHPHIGHGVLLGAGVTVLGAITVGAGSKVGAGSVVVTDLPEHCVAVGVPAAIIKRNLRDEPVAAMDQCHDFILDYVI